MFHWGFTDREEKQQMLDDMREAAKRLEKVRLEAEKAAQKAAEDESKTSEQLAEALEALRVANQRSEVLSERVSKLSKQVRFQSVVSPKGVSPKGVSPKRKGGKGKKAKARVKPKAKAAPLGEKDLPEEEKPIAVPEEKEGILLSGKKEEKEECSDTSPLPQEEEPESKDEIGSTPQEPASSTAE